MSSPRCVRPALVPVGSREVCRAIRPPSLTLRSRLASLLLLGVATACARPARPGTVVAAGPAAVPVLGAHPGLPIPASQMPLMQLAATFDSLRRAAQIPGLSIAVVVDGTVVLTRGFGYADVEARRPADSETPYNIASVTKSLSAVVALRLVERGQLDLDRPMASYHGFAEFCTASRTAGGIFFGDYACESRPGRPALTLRHVLSMTMNGTPGTRFLYNPPAYSWASRPMAEVTEVPFSTLVEELIFRPANMSRSARIHRGLPLRTDLAEALAVPYHLDSTVVPPHLVRSTPPPPQGDGAAGGVISTAGDLARFDVALDAGRLLGDSLRALMWQPTRSPTGAVAPYGMGWFVRDVEGRRVVWHTGLWEGRYSALYLKVPAERLTLILLANSDGLQWPTPLDSADIQGSAFARAFLSARLPTQR
jgi:CubicO group peptidase (beta-lactamase class C family)